MEISKKLVLARKKRGLTQEQLAGMANVTVRTIQRIENGESVPRLFTIKALADALEMNFEDLSDGLHAYPLARPTISDDNNELESEKHFLKICCLSCFSYLLIPLVHFLIPAYLLKKTTIRNPQIIAFGHKIIRQQIYWQVALSLLLLLTLGFNFLMVFFFGNGFLLNYLWVFFVMYFFNTVIIAKKYQTIGVMKF